MSDKPSGSATLILGGARSGKSRYASALALAAHETPMLIATAQPLDEEMSKRIQMHQSDRSVAWTTVECALDIVPALQQIPRDQTIVVDCLTLWLSNLMHHERDWRAAGDELCDHVRTSQQRLIFVSNELGLGLVPETALGRAFRDAQGWLNQALAAVVDDVFFIAAGLPLQLK